jgi:MinD superfamily P-loop ATPase
VIKAAKAQRDANRISIVDSPPGTSCTVVESVFDADFVIVVTEPTPFGLHDLKLMVETLNQLHRHFGVVINRFHGEYHLVHEYLEKHQIPLLMEIPYRDEFARWYSQGEIFVAKDAELLKGFTKLFEDVKQIFIQKSMYL